MKAFEYAAPTTVDEAVKLLGAPGAAALSGGTDLISRMKDYVSSPDRVVYLKDIKELAGISGDAKSSGLTIGAGTRLTDIVANAGIREAYPALWQATLEVGSPQIRNMATLGGNLLQRPRCWYFRAGHGLLGMKDGKSLVRAGDNRYHAIFMTDGDALFVSPSSLAVALCALDAQASITEPQGHAHREARRAVPGSQARDRQRADDRAGRDPHQGDDSRGQGQERLVRGPAQASPGLADRAGLGQPHARRRHRSLPPGSSSTAWRRSRTEARPPRTRSPASG